MGDQEIRNMSQPIERKETVGKAERETQILKILQADNLPEHKEAVPLDDLDREILENFQRDAFFSYAPLARKWDVTTATIRNRINRMKEAGVMDVILVMNPYKIGYSAFSIIGIRLKDDVKIDNVASNLLAIPGVTNVIMVAGRYDFFVHYIGKNMEEYRRFVIETLREIPGILSIESFIGLDLYERPFELASR